MNENTQLTMKDIARELGISVATVSRALKDSPRISAEQRKRIQEVRDIQSDAELHRNRNIPG